MYSTHIWCAVKKNCCWQQLVKNVHTSLLSVRCCVTQDLEGYSADLPQTVKVSSNVHLGLSWTLNSEFLTSSQDCLLILGRWTFHHHCDDTNSHQSWSINYIKIDAQSFDEWPPELPCREAGWYLFSHQPRLPTEQWASQAIVFWLILQPPSSLSCMRNPQALLVYDCYSDHALEKPRRGAWIWSRWRDSPKLFRKLENGGGRRKESFGRSSGRYSTNPPCARHMFTIYSPLTHQHHPYVRKVFH